ncbi:MAG: putative glycolipid-binding domain-containing protein [Candidatus Eremiobacter antarcticus]|nr:putative glycolipid-binding domain-containing protein [Candidatus Eremiobacteraeota bacterium]MBC5808014.1 putative glycolipid-binding domain-containing protein [Candidatus Eremiobacteraeota bacterium]
MTSLLAQVRAWARYDGLGMEYFTLSHDGGGCSLAGHVILSHAGRAQLIDYHIACDEKFETRSCRIVAAAGAERRQLELRREDLLGCAELDLEFTPSTNTLPIHRLKLDVGQTARITCAWVRYPGFSIEPLQQSYTRLSEARYRYQSGSFHADLDVDQWGLVRDYPNGWRAIGAN